MAANALFKLIAVLLLCAAPMPDPGVYKLSATKQGELLVHCANGADATIRPVKQFGSIVVSCGK